jgi:inorganic pyrophosphatase
MQESPLNEPFWTSLEALIQSSAIVIDRPKGSAHPRYPDMRYPLDYGYLKGTSSGDGMEIDLWRGSLPEPGLDAVVCTVDRLKRDVEIKLLLGCTEEEQGMICDFHNNGTQMSAILLKRDELPTSPHVGL